ncbi:hypothetical protein [Demequina sp.]|uniref:hypothetical protein n=1 Tax=Demequina sp. TaxID=2050685 RepID=UPI0025BC39EE|nr:hypothetical protein [Demequina sp.]
MAAKHKYQHAHVTASSKTLQPEALLKLARDVIGEIKEAQVDETLDGGLSVLVRSWAKVKLMHFAVLASESNGVSQVTSEILEFRTNQATLLYFIPIGPKELLGYKPYKNFMELYAKAIKTVDPAATVRVVELAPAGVNK